MVSTELIAALSEARRRVSPESWHVLVRQFAASRCSPDPASIQLASAAVPNADAAWILKEALGKASESTTWNEIAAATITVDELISGCRSPVDLIWTGPTSSRSHARRIDQVLYDLISAAQRRIMLVTFAAHRVPHLCNHLMEAVNRGVDLTLIVESEGESEGQLTLDAVTAFRAVPVAGRRIYYWPLAGRERNQSGRPGKLHAKCAIVDDVALVGSANLTDDAFNRNMELGVLIHDQGAVTAIVEHFQELIQTGVLVEAQTPR